MSAELASPLAGGGAAGELRVCVSVDVDAVSLWTSTFRSASPSEISRGEFAPLVAVPRLLELLARRAIPATFFVPAITARQFPAAVESILAGGHEIGVHGDLHERVVKLSREEEAEVLGRSVETLEALTGASPRGYRSPGWELSLNTIGLLADAGFAYDSSQMATEFVPYRARRDDRVEGAEWHPGPETDVWELPPAWELDDFPPFFIRPPAFAGGARVADVEAAWLEELEFARAVPGAVFTLTLHPEVIGRGPRLRMLDRLLERIEGEGGVRFLRLIDVADELRDINQGKADA